jgi:multidrug efflux pump subunit AcrA (membrane-fusion protein)
MRTVLILFGLCLWMGSLPVIAQNHQQHEDKKDALFQCPMHPKIIRNKAGSCPVCGMDLVPVKTSPKSGEKSKEQGNLYNVSVAPAMIQKMGVRLSVVKKEVISKEIRAYAKVSAAESRIYHVHPKINGWVEKIYVDSTGERVTKGKPLLSFYSPEIYAGFQDYVTALQSRDLPLATSAKNRLKLWDVSDTQLEEVAQTLKAPRLMMYESPIDGYVLNRHNTYEGMFIKSGMKVFTVADIDTVWAEIDIYEFESPWVKVGLNAIMTLPYVPGEAYKGKVTFVSPFVDEKRRTIYARLEFPNPSLLIKPGMFANVSIFVASEQPVLHIPVAAVLRSGRRNIAFVSKGDGEFEPREVVLGKVGVHESKERVYEILKGLNEGEQVVTSGQFLLDSESRLQEAIQKMISQGSSD